MATEKSQDNTRKMEIYMKTKQKEGGVKIYTSLKALKKKEITGDAASRQGGRLENVKRELLKLKKKEAADCQLWHSVDKTEETEEQGNSRFFRHGITWAGEKSQKTEEERNSRLAVMGQRSQQRKSRRNRTKK
ncbi:hypothetical protein AVEN_153669-1 [Araneus ventricosus]|uniref:Uncharacterized protein n=1 Tax=Araneus ventricosus TaxID=182803 RepID=A0A4Y2U4C5_ARAVE|nr:hypothetical protein AVEN_153669-1 [Araneus ventricosus]